MSAHDAMNEVQFTQRTRKNSRGITATTISARQNDKTVGAARLTEHNTYLDSVEVRPEARGQGVGHALMGQVTKKFGQNTLRLQASPYGEAPGPGRPELMAFYGKHGFTSDDTTLSGRMSRQP